MAEPNDRNWPKCVRQGCMGARLAASRRCLAHASSEERDAALRVISESGEVDGRGVLFNPALLAQVLAALPRGDDGKPVFKASQFDDATFMGDSWFGDASSDPRFGGLTFAGEARFYGATFTGDATFVRATFAGPAGFNGVTIKGRAAFWSASFNSYAGFNGTTFKGDAWWSGATFARDVGFEATIFARGANFSSATFGGGARFSGAVFCGPAVFTKTRFEQAREFGPLLAYQELILDDTWFAQHVWMEVSAAEVSCRRARFPAGVQFWLRWARVVLDDADFPAFPTPSILSGIPHLSRAMSRGSVEVDVYIEDFPAREKRIAQAWQRLLGGQIAERPQLLSLRGANVAGLRLSNVRLVDCRFAGAHNLDMLRLEANVVFAAAPAPLGRLSWEGRQVIAEERAWRADRLYRWGWTAPRWPYCLGERPEWWQEGQDVGLWPDWWGEPPEVLDAGQIADLPRAPQEPRGHKR